MLRRKSLNLASALMIGALTLSVAACEREGPAEEAGEELDQAVDSATDAAPAQPPAP